MARYTHGHHESVLRSHRNRTVASSAAYLEPHLTKDQSVLDVGAGPGSITADLAGRVAAVMATEIGEAQLALTQQTIRDAQLENVSFSVEDVQALSFADNTFDVVHTHQVLQHVADPVKALKEMRRVAKPGGIVAARDSDYGGFLWYPNSVGLTAWLDLYRRAAFSNGGNPDAGRRLHAWARAAGFTSITASASTWCYTTPAEVHWWGGLWEQRMLHSALADQLVEDGLATRAELEEISHAWKQWAEHPDAWFLIPHGEIICRRLPAEEESELRRK